MEIVFYTSDHGFGHAMRAIFLAEELIREVRFVILSAIGQTGSSVGCPLIPLWYIGVRSIRDYGSPTGSTSMFREP